jgi:putative hydrolase of the HAD superfamily
MSTREKLPQAPVARSPISPAPLALVLDFGCIVTKSVFELPEAVAGAFGLPPGAFPWRGPLDPATDDLWVAMQRDELTEREYWARRAAQIGELAQRPLDTRQFMVGIYEAAGPDGFRPEIDPLVADARRAGMKIGILTNELELFHGRGFIDTLPLLQTADAFVDATRTGILKPDPRAYAAVANALDLPPDRVLFVDDQPRNVAGARRIGMHAVHLRIEDVAGSIAEVRAALGLTA